MKPLLKLLRTPLTILKTQVVDRITALGSRGAGQATGTAQKAAKRVQSSVPKRKTNAQIHAEQAAARVAAEGTTAAPSVPAVARSGHSKPNLDTIATEVRVEQAVQDARENEDR